VPTSTQVASTSSVAQLPVSPDVVLAVILSSVIVVAPTSTSPSCVKVIV
jgi:hypothetical protein